MGDARNKFMRDKRCAVSAPLQKRLLPN